ncbi:hypothetical protein M405DRAFT_824612 [Rhizopogon salebrosus TDB-379]|nr:hypothetical protein M405DRAFT_824612 [Rhizopogon salebrosus TDB-379]
MPPGILLSHYPVGPVASPRCVAHSSYYFGGSEVHYAASSSLLIFWDSQLTSDHLTQARAILRPVLILEPYGFWADVAGWRG